MQPVGDDKSLARGVDDVSVRRVINGHVFDVPLPFRSCLVWCTATEHHALTQFVVRTPATKDKLTSQNLLQLLHEVMRETVRYRTEQDGMGTGTEGTKIDGSLSRLLVAHTR